MSTAPRRPFPWVYVAIAAPAVVALGVLAVVLSRSRPPASAPAPVAAPPVARPLRPPGAILRKAAPIPPPASALPNPERDFRTRIERLGLPLSRRQAIFRAWVAAESRAMWEANRLYRPIDQWRELQHYITDAQERYRGWVLAKEGLTRPQLDLIMKEAFIDNWPIPPYPSIDIGRVAQDLHVDVMRVRGEPEYHRPECRLLVGKPHVYRDSLYRAVSDTSARPCFSCQP
jgi:hypothetical protein